MPPDLPAPTAARAAPDALDFRFAFSPPARLVGRFFGITPDSASVRVEGERFTARFGPWTVDTSLANIAGASVTGPYSWPRILGPARMSIRDRGLTFASTDRQGVCIRFREPVTGIDALGLIRHPGLTVTVEDAPALVELLEQAAESSAGRRAAPTADELVVEVADDLQGMTARDLRDRARELGLKGVASMKKDELVAALSHHADS